MLQILGAFLFSLTPVASAEFTSPKVVRACAHFFLKKAPAVSPRDPLLAVLLRANAEVPQRLDFINLSAVARYLVDPVPSRILQEPLTKAEMTRLKQAMNRAHAAFEITYAAEETFWELVAAAFGRRKPVPVSYSRVSRANLTNLMDYSFSALALQLAELQARLEHRYEKPAETKVDQVEKYLERAPAWRRAFGERLDDYYIQTPSPVCREILADWGRRLGKVLWSPGVREHTKTYRATTAALFKEHDTFLGTRELPQYEAIAALSTHVHAALTAEFGWNDEDHIFFQFLESVLISRDDLAKRIERLKQ